MSIAVLTQVYAEARRLAIAGSVVARGDFRLKKLLPPLEQAGKQAPIFAKVAEAATAVIEGPEESSASALLELTSLVNAVLYTQGETGITGALTPVETTNLGGSIVQTSARELKPLLEALTSTGSGRVELVKDAIDRGLFRDIRLVKPAIAALDDPYPEIAEMVATKVLPQYGKAILPELQTKYDIKGTRGHARRLTLMNKLDPEGTRELVKSTLENGSKDTKVAAISCLGLDEKDLPFLIEQAASKTQDVRHAAYQALAKSAHADAVAVLAKALTGKDYEQTAFTIRHANNPKMSELLIVEIRKGIENLPKQKDKKATSVAIERVNTLIQALPKIEDPNTEALLLDLFKNRRDFVKFKGDIYSGSDISETIIQKMAYGSKSIQNALVAVHAELTDSELPFAFLAGRHCLTPAKLYDLFSPYITAKIDEKKKSKDPAALKMVALLNHIEGHYRSYYYWFDDDDFDDDDLDFDDDDQPMAKPRPYDERWLDLAVSMKRVGLVQCMAKPGHVAAQQFAKAEFDAALKKAKAPDELISQLNLLFRLHHPESTEAFFAALDKRSKKKNLHQCYWLRNLIPRLPKETIPQLEAIIPSLSDGDANMWLASIEQLRTKA